MQFFCTGERKYKSEGSGFTDIVINKRNEIKSILKACGNTVYLADGEWRSTPFFAVIEQRWKRNKSNFEDTQTEIGSVSADYFTYIGPFDRDIEALSEKGYVICDGKEYIFKKKQKVSIGDKVQLYWAVLRQKTKGGYDSI